MAKAATTIVPFLDAPIFKASMAPISGLAQMILKTDPQRRQKMQVVAVLME
jgi:hypothetical protein